METIKRLEPVTLLILVLGALNWGMVGLFGENVVSDVFGNGTLTDVVYTIVGVCGVLYVPQVLEGMHLGGQPIHRRLVLFRQQSEDLRVAGLGLDDAVRRLLLLADLGHDGPDETVQLVGGDLGVAVLVATPITLKSLVLSF